MLEGRMRDEQHIADVSESRTSVGITAPVSHQNEEQPRADDGDRVHSTRWRRSVSNHVQCPQRQQSRDSVLVEVRTGEWQFLGGIVVHGPARALAVESAAVGEAA